MNSSRFGGVNLLLLAVTVGAVLFGVWSFVAGSNPSDTPRNTPSPDESMVGADDRGDVDLPSGGRRQEKHRAPRTDSSSGPATGSVGTSQAAGLKIELRLPASDPSDKGEAVIEGRVLSADGKAASGIAVTAVRSNLNLGPAPTDTGDISKYHEAIEKFIAASARERRTTMTDAEGKFRFEGLDGRLSYNLLAGGDGIGSGRADRVATGDAPVIILAPDTQLRGLVKDAEGKPVTSFAIRSWRQGRDWEGKSQNFQAEDGRFSVSGKPGSWLVEVSAQGYAKSDQLEAAVGADAPELVVTLGRAAIVSGTVKDESGAPLAGAQVYFGGARNRDVERGYWEGYQTRGATATTDSLGRYRLDSLTPKEQQLTASFGASNNTQKIDAREGENTLDFTLSAGARVVLKLAGTAGQSVEADEVWFQTKNQQWVQATRLPTKTPGRTEYAGLTPGEYSVTVTAAGWPAMRKTITVKEGANEFEFQFVEGATLLGTVTGAGGAALEGIGVRLRKEDEDQYAGWNTGRFANVRTEGRYKLGPAEPGQWKLEVYVTNSWKIVHSTNVTLTAGENTHNLVIESAGTVTVTVTDDSGAVVPWAEIQLRGEQTHNGRADTNGKATISFVQPGTYQVTATSQNMVSKNYPISVRNGDNPLSVVLTKANACRLTHVYPETQAAKVGLQIGDIVLEYNNEQISSWRVLSAAIRKTKAAEDVVVLVERNGQILTFNVKGGTLGVEGADAAR